MILPMTKTGKSRLRYKKVAIIVKKKKGTNLNASSFRENPIQIYKFKKHNKINGNAHTSP